MPPIIRPLLSFAVVPALLVLGIDSNTNTLAAAETAPKPVTPLHKQLQMRKPQAKAQVSEEGQELAKYYAVHAAAEADKRPSIEKRIKAWWNNYVPSQQARPDSNATWTILPSYTYNAQFRSVCNIRVNSTTFSPLNPQVFEFSIVYYEKPNEMPGASIMTEKFEGFPARFTSTSVSVRVGQWFVQGGRSNTAYGTRAMVEERLKLFKLKELASVTLPPAPAK